MKKTLTSLLVGAACVAASIVQAQISVGPSGAGPLTFATTPTASEFSTFVLQGSGTTFADATTLDTAVALLTVPGINAISRALPTSTTVPPSAFSGGFRHNNGTGLYLQSRPTTDGTNAAGAMLATLVNNSGANRPSLLISYDFNSFNALAGELPGFHVYYSLTGEASSWQPIPELTGSEVVGNVFASLSLGSWPVGASLYLLWVDDNANGITDPSYTMDNMKVAFAGDPPTIVTQPSNTTNIVGRTVSLTVAANGSGLVYQWVKIGSGPIDTTANPSAATASLVITNAQLTDTANYYVSVSSPFGGVDSTSAHIQINPDTLAPRLLRARLGANPNQIILVVDEELCNNGPACGTVFTDLPILTFQIVNIADENNVLGVTEATSVNTTNIILTTDTAWSAENVYRITISHDNGGISDLSGNVTPAGTFVNTDPVVTAIAVGPTGSATYTFDAAPGVLEFSTVRFPPPEGNGGTTDTTAAFDARVQELDAAIINVPIGEAAGTPPALATQAQWAGAGGYLITRPTTVVGNVIMAHLRNKSGASRPALDISYNLTVEAQVVEETLGHLVYYSFSGAPNSWVQIPGLSNNDVTGLKTASLDFGATPWDAEANLYILFADDNGSGTDSANEIDNFKASFPALGVPPSITQNPSNVSTNEGAVVHLTVVAAGSPTLQYRWFKGQAVTALTDDGNISGATTARLTISNAVPADAGSYTCLVYNDTPPAATSTAAIVTINADTTRPVLTRAVGPNNMTVILTFSKALSLGAGLTSHYTVSGVSVTAAVLANNVVTLTTSARAAGNSTLTITGVTDNRSTPNMINPNPTTVALTTVQVIDAWNSTWSFNTNNLDAAPTWKTTGGAGWETGNALFGTETSAGVVALFPTPIATMIPPNTNTPSDFVTAYFRKSVTLPALGAGMSYALNHFIDDGAVFYLDGVEFGRLNMPSGAVAYATKATTAGEATLLSLPLIATAGAHTLAVEVHQGGATTSSDMLFGAQIIAIQTAGPSLSVAQVGTNAVVNWTADATWQLVGSTNVAGPYAPVAGNPFRTLTTPKTQATQFYELHYVPQP